MIIKSALIYFLSILERSRQTQIARKKDIKQKEVEEEKEFADYWKTRNKGMLKTKHNVVISKMSYLIS